MRDKSPPGFPLKFFKWFCHPHYHSNIEGDLLELYGRRVENLGATKANWLLYKDIILLFRPGIIRKFKLFPTFNFSIMLRHNLMLTLRTFSRYKTSFLINLIGLSTGLSCALLIYLWVNDELQMDKFHEKDEQLYQIMEHREQDGGIWTDAGTSGPLAEALRADMPEVEYIAAVGPVRWRGFNNFTLSVGERSTRGAGQFVGADYFNIFSYELIQGHKGQVLADKNAIVLSEEMALNLFNTTEDIIGKAVEFQHEQPFTVTGIFKNIPPNSTVQFDFLLTFETLKEMMPWVDSYGSTGPEIYLILREGTDVDLFNDKLAGFISKLSNNEETSRTLFAKPYSDNYLYGKYENGKQVGGRIEYVRLFSYIAVFILLIACINFMNLSTARASRKLTEIGIKKVVGAGRSTLIFQYIGESILMALFSLITAVLMVILFLPQFNQITGKQLGLSPDPALLAPALLLTLLTGVIAGSYPALYLSGFKPINLFKGNQGTGVGEIWSRRGLVTFQFILSIILIVSVGVTYKQIEFVQQQDLGYDRENVIWFDIEGQLKRDHEAFLSEVKRIAGVNQAAATAHSMIGHNWSTIGLEWEGSSPNNQINFQIAGIDFDFLETIGVEIKEGRSFARDFGRESEKIIFNEAAIKAMGLKDPIGKTVKTFMGEKEIIGVAKDFHFESFEDSGRLGFGK